MPKITKRIVEAAEPRDKDYIIFDSDLRWSPLTGQFAKLGSPIQKDEPDGGTTEAVFSGF